MKARELQVGDIFTYIQDSGQVSPKRIVLSNPHPVRKDAISVGNIPGEGGKIGVMPSDGWWLDDSKEVNLITKQITEVEKMEFDFNNQSEYLYLRLSVGDVGYFINEKVFMGYELISTTPTPTHEVDVLMVKYAS